MNELSKFQVKSCLFFVIILLPLLGSFALAAEPPLVENRLKIRQQYWQMLPDVSWVNVDQKGDPWFSRPKGHVAKSYEKEIHTLPAELKMLWGDRAGRIWVKPRYRDEAVRYYDGLSWHETDIKARLITEDDAGRVFLMDATAIHVLEQDQWTKQLIFAREADAYAHFVKDEKDRVWFWATRAPRNSATAEIQSGTRGVWSFDNGKWSNFSSDDGFPFDDVKTVLPLGKNRFLVLSANRKALPNFSVWSPDGRLNDQKSPLFGDDEAPSQLFYDATDQAGTHFFSAVGGKSELVTIDGDEVVTWLSAKQISMRRQMLKGIYENRKRLYSKLDEPQHPCPLDPGEVICQDRHGRIYFRYTLGIGVLWPEFEKPGDTLRISLERQMHQVFQDSSGAIWAQPYRGEVALVKWTTEGWRDTPVKIPAYPRWQNRRGPPWHLWQTYSPVLMPGDDGTFLVVAIRDVYQDVAAAQKLQEAIPWAKLRELADEQIEKRGTERWFEAWYFVDGNWSGPLPVEALLNNHRDSLIKNFTINSRQTSLFNLQSDGKHLWVAYDGKVKVFDSENNIFAWEIPNQTNMGISQSCLCRLSDGTMLCSSPTDPYAKFQLYTLRLKKDHIEAKEFARPNDAKYVSRNPRWNDWYPYNSRRGDLWLWLGHQVYQFTNKDEGWTLREDLGRPLFEEADGSLWFMPGIGFDGRDENRGYRIVKGDKTSTFSWPVEYMFGWLTPSPSGEIHAACGYWHVTLSAADEPLNRRITKAQINSTYLGTGVAAFQIEKGKFVFSNGFLGTETN